MKGVSVIICCYNSALRLPETLKHLMQQKNDAGIEWEIIIVNNNSTDNTVAVATEILTTASLNKTNFIVVEETEPGLSHARFKGIATAKYAYAIFCDDDNWLNENYISIAYQIMEMDSTIGVAGGQSTAATNSATGFPEWFNKYQAGYAVGKQAEKTGNVNERKYLWGAGMVFRKQLFLEAFNDKPSLLTDRKGNELSAGGDSEICMRIILLGYQLWYDERLTFQHFITAERLTETYREKLFAGFQATSSVSAAYGLYIDYTLWSWTKKIYAVSLSAIKFLLMKASIYQKTMLHYNSLLVYVATGFASKEISDQTKETVLLAKLLQRKSKKRKVALLATVRAW